MSWENDYVNNMAKVHSIEQNNVCGEQCKRDRKIANLRQVYEAKKINLKTAPEQVDIAHKDYVEYAFGVDKWIQEKTKNLTKDSKDIKDNTLKEWKKEAKRISHFIDNYEESYDALKELGHFKHRMIASNNKLLHKYDKEHNDITTDDRQAFYELQGTDDLRWWQRIMKWTYIFMVLAFIIASFVVPNEYSWKQRGIVIIALILYPILISFVSIASFATIRSLLELIPYNTYTSSIGITRPNTVDKPEADGNKRNYTVPDLNLNE